MYFFAVAATCSPREGPELLELLLEEREKNVDNQARIEELKAKVAWGNEILRRFEALQA